MIILYILAAIFAVILILLGIAAIRAIVIKKEYGDDKPFDMEKDSIDWKTHAEHLSRIIQVPTVSIRGNTDKNPDIQAARPFSGNLSKYTQGLRGNRYRRRSAFQMEGQGQLQKANTAYVPSGRC